MSSGSRPRAAGFAQGPFRSVALPILFFLFACAPFAGADISSGFQLRKFDNTTIYCYRSSGLTPDDHVLRGAICLAPPDVNQSLGDISGNCVYKDRLHFDSVGSFSTMFSFTTLVYDQFQQGQGFTFFIGPNNNTQGGTGGYLGWLNQNTTNSKGRNFAVEFDIFSNPEFNDSSEDHIGMNFNSMKSAWYVNASNLDFNLTTYASNAKLYAWITYDGRKSTVEVSINDKPHKPCKAIISHNLPWNYQQYFQGDMYVGFASSTGGEIDAQTTIWDWSFNTSGEAENLYGGKAQCHWTPSRSFYMTLISAVLAAIVILLLGVILFLRRGGVKKVKDLEEEKAGLVRELKKLDFGAREFKYQDLKEATAGFTHAIGEGGFGKVYIGKVFDETVAVKRIKETPKSNEDAKQLVAEVQVIGRLRHKNIVPLLGWCHERGQMFLVYKYMENGDLGDHLFPTDSLGADVLPWQKRMDILKGVAAALVFLHDEFASEQRVIHRDVKPRNVMLDAQFNARLGDFGLAQLCERTFKFHYGGPGEIVMGTRGFVAPEYEMGATTATDVYSFGVLLLVVVTGRMPLEKSVEDYGGLVKWVRRKHDSGSISAAGDLKLKTDHFFNREEMEKVLKIGLFCCLHEADARPTMRDVVTALHGNCPIFSCPLPPQTPPPLSIERSLKKFDMDHSFGNISNTDSGYHSSERFVTGQMFPDFSSDREFHNSGKFR